MKLIGQFPQPLKGLYVAMVAMFVLAVVGTATVGRAWVVLPLGLVALALGGVLLSNFNGNADGMAAAMKAFRPMGVDNSQSLLVTKGYARTFGLISTLAGVLITAAGLFS